MRSLMIAALMLVGLTGFGPALAAEEGKGVAIFAGGCFWCVESDFDRVPGVIATTSGFTGGHTANPTYREVVSKKTGHREAVRIEFDPAQVSYAALLHAYWRSVDPTDAGGQFCDRGEPYQTAVFVTDAEQRALAEQTKAEAAAELSAAIVTTIEEAGPFYPAEDYHQNYAADNALTYRLYRWRCGRDQRVREVWGAAAFSGIPSH